jgi:DnaK suppressor protein
MAASKKKNKYKEIREMLVEERERLVLSAKKALADRHEEVGENREIEEMDVSTNEILRSTELRLRDRERFLLKKIDGSIARIDEDEYGLCKECEEEIPLARLKARPVTDLCISCKESQENDEKNKITRRQQRWNEDMGNLNF